MDFTSGYWSRYQEMCIRDSDKVVKKVVGRQGWLESIAIEVNRAGNLLKVDGGANWDRWLSREREGMAVYKEKGEADKRRKYLLSLGYDDELIQFTKSQGSTWYDFNEKCEFLSYGMKKKVCHRPVGTLTCTMDTVNLSQPAPVTVMSSFFFTLYSSLQ